LLNDLTCCFSGRTRVLLLGLGGADHWPNSATDASPDANITAVEVSADVIALRMEFSIPEDDRRLRFNRADGAI
jgi:hypothetical protein